MESVYGTRVCMRVTASSPSLRPVASLVSLAWLANFPRSLAQFNVPGAVNVSPTDTILDSIGLGDLFGSSSKKNVTTLWYFWVIIAILAIFVVVAAWFTYRGFKRWRTVREENRLKFLVPGAVAVQYFDETTEDWILDMSKRTGRPVDECKAAGARHCAGQTFAGRSREINRAMTFAASTMRRDRDLAVLGTDVPTVIVEDVAEDDDK